MIQAFCAWLGLPVDVVFVILFAAFIIACCRRGASGSYSPAGYRGGYPASEEPIGGMPQGGSQMVANPTPVSICPNCKVVTNGPHFRDCPFRKGQEIFLG